MSNETREIECKHEIEQLIKEDQIKDALLRALDYYNRGKPFRHIIINLIENLIEILD